jgi:hypothetical protein
MAAVLRIVDMKVACMAQGQLDRLNTPATVTTARFTLRQDEEHGTIVETFLAHSCRMIFSFSPTARKDSAGGVHAKSLAALG